MIKHSHFLPLSILLLFAMPATAFDFSDLGKIQQYAGKGAQLFTSVRKGIEDLTPEEEYYIGRSVSARILADYPPINHIKINDYLNQLGGWLSRYSSRPITFGGYHFQVVRSSEINAFAAPGGFIVITSGLYNLLDNEEQLAAVLAHEIAHVTLNHGLSAIQTSNLTDAFTLIGKTAMEESGRGQQLSNVRQLTSIFSTSIDDILNRLVVSGYSRDQELAADAEALRILYRAGYDPSGLAGFLERLAQGGGANGGFYATHPPAGGRLDAARREIADKNWHGQGLAQRDKRFRAHVLN